MRPSLRKRDEFRHVFDDGRWVTRRGAPLSILFRKAELFRCGLVLRKKLGNAVLRNRLRRQLWAILHEGLGQQCWQGHFVIFVNPEFTTFQFQEMREHVQTTMGRVMARSR